MPPKLFPHNYMNVSEMVYDTDGQVINYYHIICGATCGAVIIDDTKEDRIVIDRIVPIIKEQEEIDWKTMTWGVQTYWLPEMIDILAAVEDWIMENCEHDGLNDQTVVK